MSGSSQPGDGRGTSEGFSTSVPDADVVTPDTPAERATLDALDGPDVETVLVSHGDSLGAGGTAPIEQVPVDLDPVPPWHSSVVLRDV